MQAKLIVTINSLGLSGNHTPINDLRWPWKVVKRSVHRHLWCCTETGRVAGDQCAVDTQLSACHKPTLHNKSRLRLVLSICMQRSYVKCNLVQSKLHTIYETYVSIVIFLPRDATRAVMHCWFASASFSGPLLSHSVEFCGCVCGFVRNFEVKYLGNQRS